MHKRIAINDLRPGMVIVQITEQNGPVKIRKSGLVTSTDMVTGLAEMGVCEVEIDESQTVEVESNHGDLSPTQALLASSATSRGRDLDSELSEQFNRSLFLPTARAIPSLWQFYAKRGAIALATMALGIVSGFALSHLPYVLDSYGPKAVPQSVSADTTGAGEDDGSETPAAKQTGQTAEPETAARTEEASALSAKVPDAAAQEVAPNPESDEQMIAKPAADPLANVSPELLARFEQAVAEVDGNPELVSPTEDGVITTSTVKRVDELPAWILTELPRMVFTTHIYASEASDRWVNVNGTELGEGDWINDDLMIRRIDQQLVILNYKGHEFSLPALTDW